MQGRDSTKEFAKLENCSQEIHEECATELEGLEPTDLLRCDALSGMVPQPISHGGSSITFIPIFHLLC